jgi:hypothetical protein
VGVHNVLHALAQEGKISTQTVSQAIREFNLDTNQAI